MSTSTRSAMSERQAARRLTKRIEGMLDIAEGQETGDLLDTARQLARLGDWFGPPDPAFERRLTARIEARLAERPPRRTAWRLRPVWGLVAGLVLVVVGLFTSPGQAVVAELMAVFRLGRTQVRVEPETTRPVKASATAEITLPGLPEAQAAVEPRTLQVPAYLPQGYRLHRLSTRHFDELPAWVQPLFIEVIYRQETAEVIWELAYRQYFVASGGEGTIQALTYPTKEFESVQKVTVGGRPAVLLTRPPASPVQPGEQVLHLVWEGENAVFTLLTSSTLLPDELVRIAESVTPYR
jgi:hypothetical protein